MVAGDPTPARGSVRRARACMRKRLRGARASGTRERVEREKAGAPQKTAASPGSIQEIGEENLRFKVSPARQQLRNASDQTVSHTRENGVNASLGELQPRDEW